MTSRIAAVLMMILPSAGMAHTPFTSAPDERLPPALGIALLGIVWVAYTLGAWRVKPGHWRLWAFHAAAVLALLALFGPLDHWAETSAAWHMVQHMLMMVAIAPLWVLAQPLPQIAATAPRFWPALWSPLLKVTAYPMAAALLHAGFIWFWHAPRFYVLALDNPWWHVVEHACFIFSAVLFWWAVLRVNPQRFARAMLALLFTLMHTGFLGALLTFAREPLYGAERNLQSQQLAGLLMWVMGGVPYMAAAAWLGVRWFRQLMRRAASAAAAND